MKLKTLLLLCLCLFAGISISAYDAEIDGIYYNLSGNEAEVTFLYNNSSRNSDAYSDAVVIPESITYEDMDYRVVGIGSYAFAYCKNLTSVKIPSTLKSVKRGAFNGCSSLAKVIVTDIAAWCGIIYEGDDYHGDFPLGRAMHLYSDENTEITEVIIPEGVTRIEERAFRDAKYVTSITIPNSVTHIAAEAFRGMHRLTSISIPQGITSIEKVTFHDCQSLTSVNIPGSVRQIGEHAFWNCISLPSITIPEGVEFIDKAAFEGCSALASVSLPNSLAAINIYAFQYCSSLTSISIPVRSIYAYTFYGCSKLSSVTVRSDLISIDVGAFDGCQVKNLYVRMTDYSAFCYNSNLLLTKIQSQITLLDEEGNEVKEYTVPEDVTDIGEYAFQGCSGLTSVIIPGSVTGIGDYAFQGCTRLTTANIPQGVTGIGKRAFEKCSDLISVSIPNSVTTVGSVPFNACTNITFINLDCDNIGNSWFPSSKKKLKTVVLGEHVRELSNTAFKNYTGLKEIWCYAEEPPTVVASSFEGVDVASVMLVVPDESYEAYKAHEVWGQFWIETPTGIPSLAPNPSHRRGDIYNVAGQRMNKMQKGINIKDGKKVLVK